MRREKMSNAGLVPLGAPFSVTSAWVCEVTMRLSVASGVGSGTLMAKAADDRNSSAATRTPRKKSQQSSHSLMSFQPCR